jgi:peptidoglycan/LPS O-acetylase OafA/YrhL
VNGERIRASPSQVLYQVVVQPTSSGLSPSSGGSHLTHPSTSVAAKEHAPARPPSQAYGPRHRAAGRSSGAASHDEYLGRRYFATLDGLRAVSILLVITAHASDPLFNRLHGAVGVTIFFVISGYLITTLLLREEGRNGRARIKAFYIRRAFRILPLYYLTLTMYIVFIGVLHLQAGAADLWHSLPWYLAYQNDLVPHGAMTFNQSWSLAVEEKYYFMWPLMFAIPMLRKHRLTVVSSLAVLTALASLWTATYYFAVYTPILLGCAVALVLNDPVLYRRAVPLASTPVALIIIAALIAWDLSFGNGSRVHIVFGVLIALLFPAVLVGPRWLSGLLSNRIVVYIGTRSYAVYLIHRIAKGIVDRVISYGSTSIPRELLHFVLIVVLSLIFAEVLYRLVEQPMIHLGRRLASTSRGDRTLPAGVEMSTGS